MKNQSSPEPSLASIFLLSVVALFLEVLLIRWIGTEIRIFAYLQNVVLVVCLLGLGLGCLTSRQKFVPRQTVLPIFVLVSLLTLPLTKNVFGSISGMLSVLEDFLIWFQVVGSRPLVSSVLVIIGLTLTYWVMLLILDAFVPLGRLLGRLMDEYPRTIVAYSSNVAGSLIGIWLFVAFSATYQPPWSWFLLVVALFSIFVLTRRPVDRVSLALLVLCPVVLLVGGLFSDAIETVWSPYQKLAIREPREGGTEVGKYILDVNGVPYQGLVDPEASSKSLESIAPDPFSVAMGIGQYELPYLFHPRPQKVLIIGAGAGNDVAGALRQEVPDITAVEIDPGIQGLGDTYHPDHPYDQANVRIEIDDARSYFVRTTERFDVISFGLLDSHTTTAMTNARLDHYVYTRESFERAKSLLKPGGVVVMSFEPQKPYITNRMAAAIREVFGSEPLVFRVLASRFGWGGVFFVSGDSRTVAHQLERKPELATAVAEAQRRLPIKIDYSTSIITDDWPYIYLKSRRIPVIFLLANALMVLLFFRSTKHWKATGTLRKWDRRHWHFFFLGAAFMLLEIAGISRSAVVLGSTWLVNAVVISGVLVMVLLANLIVAWWKKVPVKAAYVLLCLSCVCLYWINLADVGTFPYGVKVLIVGLITALPMLFSGIVFIHSFASTAQKDEALGANLFGALVGALLQTLTFLTGLSSLLLIVAALYFLAWVMSRSNRSAFQ